MNFHLNEIEHRFRGYPDFKLLSITVDPVRIVLKLFGYIRKRETLVWIKWMFTTGAKEQIYDLAKGLFLNAFEDETAEGASFIAPMPSL